MSSAPDSLVIAFLGENVGEIQLNNYKKNTCMFCLFNSIVPTFAASYETSFYFLFFW